LVLELEDGFAGAAEGLLEDVLSVEGLDSAGLDSVFDSPDDSDAGLSEFELEDDFDA
jgi:hypothetical protein